MTVKAFIDGDGLVYRCSFAAEKTKYLVTWGLGYQLHVELQDTKKEADEYSKAQHGEVWSRKDLQPLENCLQIVKSLMGDITGAIKSVYPGETVEPVIFISGKGNFREAIAVTKPYKGNRQNTPKPTYYMDVRKYLKDVWGASEVNGMEADDAISIQAHEANEECVVVSQDKDLDQIKGHHYDWTKRDFYTISHKEASHVLYTQALSGDATDNIPGLEGIGETKAKKILEGAKNSKELVDRVYEAYKLNTPYFLEQMNLVYLLRNPDWRWIDSKDGEYWEGKYT